MTDEFRVQNHDVATQAAAVARDKKATRTGQVEALPHPHASPEPTSTSFTGGATPFELGQKTRRAAQFLWGKIQMGIRRNVRVKSDDVSVSSKASRACKNALARSSETFIQLAKNHLPSHATLAAGKETLLTATHDIAKGMKSRTSSKSTPQPAESAQTASQQAFDRWKSMHKLQNVKSVLAECQAGQKKPQLKDGQLIAVDRSLDPTGKAGTSTESTAAIDFISAALEEGVSLGLTIWEEGGNLHNLSDITAQLRAVSDSLKWNKGNKKMAAMLQDLQHRVDEIVGSGSRSAVIDRLKNISQVLNICLNEDKKPRIDKEGRLTTVDTKKHSVAPRVGKKGASSATQKAMKYISSEIQHAADLKIDQWSDDGTTVRLSNLLDKYEEVGTKRKWTEANPNFAPAIQRTRQRILDTTANIAPEMTNYAVSADVQKAYSMEELMDAISTGNSKVSYILISSHRANSATVPLFNRLIKKFQSIADDRTMAPEERTIRMTNILQFGQDYLQLGLSIPVSTAERKELRSQLESLVHLGQEQNIQASADLQKLISSKLVIAPPFKLATIDNALALLESSSEKVAESGGWILKVSELKDSVSRELMMLKTGKELSQEEKNTQQELEAQLAKLEGHLKSAAQKPNLYSFENKSVEELYGDLAEVMERAFRDIPPNELDNVTKSKKAYELLPNLTHATQMFNAISDLAIDSILYAATDKQRKDAYSKVVQLIDYSLKEKHPGLAMALSAGISNSAINRLQDQLQRTKDMDSLATANTILNRASNHKTLRKHIEQGLLEGKKGVLPFLGMYQTDATFIQDGNKDSRVVTDEETRSETEMILMSKLQLQTGLKEMVSFAQLSLRDKKTRGTDFLNLSAQLALAPYRGDNDTRYKRSLEVKPKAQRA